MRVSSRSRCSVRLGLREQYVPRWLPEEEARQIDLSELATPSPSVEAECSRLEQQLGAHVAAYRSGARARPNGLCTRYQYARLKGEQLELVAEAERTHVGVVFVAYACPLTRW